MRKPASQNPLQHLRVSDLRGVAQLATQATRGAARIAEGVQQSVWGSMGVPGGKIGGTTRGLTGLIYQSVHGLTQLVGSSLQGALAHLEPVLQAVLQTSGESAQREAVLAALNGVMGDRLLASQNPLATPMTLRYLGQALAWDKMPAPAAATGKVLLLVHGLCMNDLQWQTWRDGQALSHAQVLASELGYSPVYVRYNSGLHTSQNGRELSHQLEQLMAHWPTPISELTLLVHSMGGLLARSACHYAEQEKMRWPRHLKNIVFLGTPHHGAPLERAGNWIDVILGSTPYSRPFARLGQLRSAGITDLRYGHLLDVDWQGHDRFRRQPDQRQHLPLPEGVTCFTVAATIAAKRNLLADRLTGDGLVPLRSALGQHDEPQRSLRFENSAQWIAYRTSHMALLGSPGVTQQLLAWLRPSPD